MDIQNPLQRIYEIGYTHRGKILLIITVLFIVRALIDASVRPLSSVTSNTQSIRNTQSDYGYAEELTRDSVQRDGIVPPVLGSAAGVVNPSLKDQIDSSKRIIKTAGLTIEVDVMSRSIEAISNIAVRENGFVLQSNFSEDDIGKKFANITIRVPAEKFENVIQEIKEHAAFVAFESINGSDVTEEFVDLQAELINLRAEEEQFQAILKRAFEIEDILAVTRELSRVRGAIERLEGRKRFLENQTDLSTISVSLQEAGEISVPTSKWRPGAVITQAGRDIVQSFQNFIDGSIRLVGWTLGKIPHLIVIGIIVFFVHRYMRKRKDV